MAEKIEFQELLLQVNDGPSEDPDHDFPMGYTHPDGETELVIALGEKVRAYLKSYKYCCNFCCFSK